MNRMRIESAHSHPETDWMPFPGGELEGRRPRGLCPGCRGRANGSADEAGAARPALCFQCYRVELERNRAIKAAGELDTATEVRFQSSLPFEPVNQARLARLKTVRAEARVAARAGVGGYVEKRRRAQIEARHTLARVFQGLKARRMLDVGREPARGSALEAATRAAETQLPESRLPFVVSQ